MNKEEIIESANKIKNELEVILSKNKILNIDIETFKKESGLSFASTMHNVFTKSADDMKVIIEKLGDGIDVYKRG